MNKLIEKILENKEMSKEEMEEILAEETFGDPWSGEE